MIFKHYIMIIVYNTCYETFSYITKCTACTIVLLHQSTNSSQMLEDILYIYKYISQKYVIGRKN